MEIRSFLAFELPPEIKKIIFHVSEEAKKFPLDVRLVKASNIHLTMVFMGNILMEHLEGINEAVSKACKRYGPFNISLKGMGIFSNRRNPRVLWVGLEGDIERMSYFRGTLQKSLKSFGVKEEKRQFNPHLTLGRFRKGSRPSEHLDDLLSRYQDLTSPVSTLEELVLFKSDLNPKGAAYTKLNIWPLLGKR
ncbi:MAG: RNA 2',3'-cyclic phosphodiesterase [Deltaproteobacteria bacterium]|nr:RNA 2',3'-cyclic phosphodiesterase [Deltaproteobacteria bacterium]